MVVWMSPEELAQSAASSLKLIHVAAGIYFWEFVLSLNFEWSFIRGEKRFSWPMIPYFGARYTALGMIFTCLISVDVGTQIHCQGLYTILFLCGGSSVCFSSINLAIRTMVVWNMNWLCVVPLCLLGVGQWGLTLQTGIVTRAAWNPGQGCLVTHTPERGLSAIFIYTICFDFAVLILCAVQLLTFHHGRRSKLVNLLFKDGLIYFIAAVLGNIPAGVIAFMQLNPVMDVMASLPASVVSVIAASRAVRRLSNFSVSGPAIYLTLTKPQPPDLEGQSPIQIQMNSFTTATGDSPITEPASLVKAGNNAYV